MFKQFTGNGNWGSKFHTGGNLTKLPHDNSGSSPETSLSSSESVSRTNTSSSDESSERSVPMSRIITTSTSSSSSLLSSSPRDITIQSKKKQRECVD